MKLVILKEVLLKNQLHILIYILFPNTKIPVKVPKGYMVRVNKSKKTEGVKPEITIKDHLLDDEDEILETLLQRLDS